MLRHKGLPIFDRPSHGRVDSTRPETAIPGLTTLTHAEKDALIVVLFGQLAALGDRIVELVGRVIDSRWNVRIDGSQPKPDEPEPKRA